MAGAVLLALAWIVDAVGASLPMLYLRSAVGGIGAGRVFAREATQLFAGGDAALTAFLGAFPL
jgi:hypothetical protein